MDKEKLLEYIQLYTEHKQRRWNPRTAKNNAYFFMLLTKFVSTRVFDNNLVLSFFNYLQTEGLAETTRRQAETAIIGFTKWLFNQGITKMNLSANIERTRVHRKPRILPSQQEILELINQVTEPGLNDNKLTSFSKREHRACLRFMLVACGGRITETSRILRKDISVSGLQMELVEGKGGSRAQAIPNIPWLTEDLKRRVEGRRTEQELQGT